MSGQFDFGTPLNNAGAARASLATAFSEGIYYRAGGTLAGRPLTDNPHEVGSPDHDAWDRGWAVADESVARTIVKNITAIGKDTITTITVSVAHGFTSGRQVTLAGIVDNGPGGDLEAALNGNAFTLTVIDTTSFSIPENTGGLTNIWASAGTATEANGENGSIAQSDAPGVAIPTNAVVDS